jgi:hypothetical protein
MKQGSALIAMTLLATAGSAATPLIDLREAWKGRIR